MFSIGSHPKNSFIWIVVSIILMPLAVSLSGCDNLNAIDNPDTQDNIYRLRQEGIDALSRSDFDSAYKIGNELLLLPGATASIYSKIILGQSQLFNQESEIESYTLLTRAEKECIDEGDFDALASVYNGLGLYMLNRENDNIGALKFFFEGLDAAKRADNDYKHSILLSNIALVYYRRQDPSGLRYSLECYNFGKENNLSFSIYTGAISASNFYLMNNEHDKALFMVREAENILNQKGYKDKANLYRVYGSVYTSGGNYKEAEKFFKKSLDEIDPKTDDLITTTTAYAHMYCQSGHPEKALSLLIPIHDNYENKKGERYPEYYQVLSEAYRLSGDMEKASGFATSFQNEFNAQNDPGKESALRNARMRHDYERTENALIKTEIENLKKQKILYCLVLIIAVAIYVCVSVWLAYKRKAKLYSAIVKQMSDSVKNEDILRKTIKELESKLESCLPHDSARRDMPVNKKSEIAGDGEPHICGNMDSDGSAVAEKMAGAESDNSDFTESDISNGVAADPSIPLTHEKYTQLLSRLENLMDDSSVYTDAEINKDKIAKAIGTNRTYLSIIINRTYGMSFTKFINSQRVKEAVRRLSNVEDDTPLKVLAHELGFKSATTFYKLFNEETGMTPAKFRSQAMKLK